MPAGQHDTKQKEVKSHSDNSEDNMGEMKFVSRYYKQAKNLRLKRLVNLAGISDGCSK